jgi:hypothetical protein
MPKKRRNAPRFYNSQDITISSTNQKLLKNYWRWFGHNQSFQKYRFFLNLQLPGYFTHIFEPAYKAKKPEKKKY